MKCIKLGTFDKKLLIPIIGGICRLIFTFFYKKNPKYPILSQNPFITSIYSSIGMILAFIPYLIVKYRSKSSKINSVVSQKQPSFYFKPINKPIIENIRKKKYKFFIFQEIFDFLQTVFYTFFCMNITYNFWTFDIIFISLFSYLILKTKLYRHQYISMIIIIILGFLLNVLEHLKQTNTENKLDFLEIMMTILTEIFLSMFLVVAKYNMEKNFSSPYEICIWVGLMGLILYVIIIIIINILGVEIAGIKHPDNFYSLFNNYDIYDFLLCLSYLIGQAIYNIVILLTCDYFTPIHIFIILIFKEVYNSSSFDQNIVLNLLTFFILVIMTFMFFVFIEIIELNMFQISFNTKKNIEFRSFDDSIRALSNLTPPEDDISVDEYEESNK